MFSGIRSIRLVARSRPDGSALKPLFKLLGAYLLSALRWHGDATTVPVLAKGKTDCCRGRCSITRSSPGASSHLHRHFVLRSAFFASQLTGIFQAGAYGSYGKRYGARWPDPGSRLLGACPRPFFVTGDLAGNARCKA